MTVPFLQEFDVRSDIEAAVSAERVNLAIQRATNAVVAELGWDPIEATRTLAIAAWARWVHLPAMNVTSVSVTDQAGTSLEVSWSPSGVVRVDQSFTSATVTYTAGWSLAQLPGPIQDVAADETIRRLGNLRSLRSWTVGNESETYADTGPTLGDDHRLDAYRLPGI